MADKMLSADEISEIVSRAVRSEFEAVGLRVHDSEHKDEAREDFLFIRRLRKSVTGVASKVGTAVIMAVVSGLLWLLWTGFQAVTK